MRDEEISKKLHQQMESVHVLPDLQRRTLMKIGEKEELEMKKKIALTPIVVFAILLLSVCTALATGFFWNHPLENELEIDDTNREKYQAANLLTAPTLSQTHEGITISTDQCVVDEHTAYISFRISGWSLAEGDEPGFDIAKCSLGLNESSSIGSSFICIWSDEKQAEVYADQDGTLVYGVYVSAMKESLIGRSIHIELGNPGIYRKDKSLQIDIMTEALWTFDWELTGTQEKILWEQMTQPIGNTEWTLDTFSLTPVTAIVTLTPPENWTFDDTFDGNIEGRIPFFIGITMADGTEYRLSGMGGGEVLGGDDVDIMKNAYREVVSLNHIIGDLKDVREILFAARDTQGVIRVELPDTGTYTAE